MDRRIWLQHGCIAMAAAVLAEAAPAQTTAPSPPSSIDVGGARFPVTAQLGSSTLLLNGAGTRYRFVIKVYSAGLYLTTKAATPEAALAAAGPKRVQVAMAREIDANELGKLFTRGMQDNTPREEFGRSIAGTLRLAEMFAARKRLKANDVFTVDYIPGMGATVVINGQPQGEPIKEPEFFSALLRIWLGPNPVDGTLKDAMLGRTAPPVPGSNSQQ